MRTITHQEQHDLWEQEHRKPHILLQMDSAKPSTGVIKFLDWLKEQGIATSGLRGVEMCCGKGRNVVWLATQGVRTIGLDYSKTAIEEAKERAASSGFSGRTKFVVQDVTLPFDIDADSLDFAIDCFGSTDIETLQGRKAALDNMVHVLKPGGYLLAYLLSTDDEFHKKMVEESPGPDPGSFIHVNGKYEKIFTEDEVKQFYSDLDLVSLERFSRKTVFFGKEYNCNHIWALFQKPIEVKNK